jgi:hypothetical protein
MTTRRAPAVSRCTPHLRVWLAWRIFSGRNRECVKPCRLRTHPGPTHRHPKR